MDGAEHLVRKKHDPRRGKSAGAGDVDITLNRIVMFHIDYKLQMMSGFFEDLFLNMGELHKQDARMEASPSFQMQTIQGWDNSDPRRLGQVPRSCN